MRQQTRLQRPLYPSCYKACHVQLYRSAYPPWGLERGAWLPSPFGITRSVVFCPSRFPINPRSLQAVHSRSEAHRSVSVSFVSFFVTNGMNVSLTTRVDVTSRFLTMRTSATQRMEQGDGESRSRIPFQHQGGRADDPSFFFPGGGGPSSGATSS